MSSRASLIYPLEDRRKKQLEKIGSDRYNRKILLRYYTVRKPQVELATIIRELAGLNKMSRILNKKFERATRRDIEKLVGNMDDLPNADSTKNRDWTVLIGFYRWLKGYPKKRFLPIVDWIEFKKVPITPYTADDMISEAEVIRISRFATNLRDMALIQNKVDGACRIGELLTSTIGEIKQTDYGAEIKCDGKTGSSKPIILSWSAPLLMQWLNIHPFRDNPESPIYCAFDYEKPRYLSQAGASKMLKQAARRAGVKKRIWLHMLKHVGCTADVRREMPDGLRKFKHHHSMNSKMDAVYVHMANSDIPDIQKFTMEKLNGNVGVKVLEKKEDSVLVSCKRCYFDNVVGAKYCNRCAYCLDDKVIEKSLIKTKTEEIVNQLLDDPEKIEKLEKILRSM